MRPVLDLCLFVSVMSVAAGYAQEPAPVDPDPDAPVVIVERVEILRNQFLQPESYLFYVSTKPGDRYDEHRLREDYRRLWDTGFVDDLVLDVRDGPKGKIVAFLVSERKRIQIVDYRGSKALSTTTIEDELKKKEAGLKIDSFYDMGKARRVEQILRDMLREKGRPFATVAHEARNVGASGTQVSFTIDDGPKAKVKEIAFEGNEAFSDGRLGRQMKNVKPQGFWNLSWLTGKTTYTEDKWSDPQEGDKKRLEDFYLDHGYVTATIGEPKVVYADHKTGTKPSKHIRLEIPVAEGEQYRVGEIGFEGLTVFPEPGVRPLFKLQPGDVYKESRIRKGYDKLRDAYGAQGYFQWSARTDRAPNHEKKVVDVKLVMEEDKRYYVGRIRFTGNDTTRDKVIRREVYLTEGDVFNTEALKLSIRRINQLGYFKPMEAMPGLTQSALGEDKLDVTFKVEEQNRNQFTFGGGTSGVEGAFLNASFSTSNFLGQGETLQVSAQTGGRSRHYQLSVTEPYLFDRPITAGIDLYSKKVEFLTSENTVGYSEARTGAGFTTGLPLGRFTRLYGSYTYEIIEAALADDGGAAEPTGPRPFTPFFEEGRHPESRFGLSLVHNTVDNPFMPRRGLKLSAAAQVAGGPLGGGIDYVRPELEGVFYIPHTRRTAFGLRGQVAWIRPFGDTRALPYNHRMVLGGETQIRGMDLRSVGPLDASEQVVGGNKSVLFNAEYYVDVGGPLRLVLFYDAGQAFAEGKALDLRQVRTSTGAELRFLMPVLNVPLRLIYAFNPNRDAFHRPRTPRFAIGTTF